MADCAAEQAWCAERSTSSGAEEASSSCGSTVEADGAPDSVWSTAWMTCALGSQPCSQLGSGKPCAGKPGPKILRVGNEEMRIS